MSDDQVGDAFDLLGDEISIVLGTLGTEIAKAGAAGDFATAGSLSQRAQQIEQLLDQVRAPEPRWHEVRYWPRLGDEAEPDVGAPRSPGSRRHLGRVAPGAQTSEPAFYRPILRVLADRGGSRTLGETERRMGHTFTDVERLPLPSDERQVRWRNTAQWAHNAFVQRGLMERPRRRGLGEISDGGRKSLASREDRR